MIEALVFDFDGLIIDSESPEFQVWQDVFAEHGRELGFALWADLVGRPHTHFDLYSYYQEQINPAVNIDAFRRERRFNIYQSDVPPHRVGWASPAVDPETGNVYAFGVHALAIALTKDGTPIWQRSFGE